jgi:DNA-binding transcriptional regulator YhcF (GntR family)
MIKQVRKRLAEKHVQDFLKKMTELGFDYNEIISIISAMIKTEEMKHE